MRRWPIRGLSIIELVIVVMILTILAAIVTPAVNDAFTRAGVSRASADLRTVSLAVELYTVDFARIPNPAIRFGGTASRTGTPHWIPYAQSLTTPIAYLTSLPRDPFGPQSIPWMPLQFERAGRVIVAGQECVLCIPVPADTVGTTSLTGTSWPVWVCEESQTPRPWVAYSVGPDEARGIRFDEWVRDSRYHIDDRYDPTNGVWSAGNILRFSGGEVFP